MKVKCWGVRGSLPVSGIEYSKFGGDTTCVEIQCCQNSSLVIDAGTGIKKLGSQISRSSVKEIHILFSHFHWDHLIGLPFFSPLYNGDYKINLYGHSFTEESFKGIITNTMQTPYFPVEFDSDTVKAKINFIELSPGTSFEICNVQIETLELSHPDKGLCYKFTDKAGKVFSFITDNELGYLHPGGHKLDKYIEFVKGSDLLLHDAEYKTAEYKNRIGFGHSSYEDALNLAISAKVKKFGMIHHNLERLDSDLSEIEQEIKNTLITNNINNLDVFAVINEQIITI